MAFSQPASQPGGREASQSFNPKHWTLSSSSVFFFFFFFFPSCLHWAPHPLQLSVCSCRDRATPRPFVFILAFLCLFVDIWWSGVDREKFKRGVRGQDERRWQMRLSVLFHEVTLVLFLSYVKQMFLFLLLLSTWFAETAHSICGNKFYSGADLVNRVQGGKGPGGEKVSGRSFNWSSRGRKHITSHKWRSFLTLFSVKPRMKCRYWPYMDV